jgi:alkaline phosphatase D
MKRQLIFLFIIIYSVANAQQISNDVIERIAFGSCNSQDRPQEIWYKIIDQKPQLFIFLGDNIYGDTKDMDILKKKYDQLLEKPGYIELKKNTKVLATWDDHDYGVNDGGKEYPKKVESKELFLKVFDEPAVSERRNHEGIYTSYLYGPKGKRLQVIMLDTRTFRDSLCWAGKDEDCIGEYGKCTDTSKTMLGKEQWKWLEAQLKVDADLRIIGTSTQLLQDFNGWEGWINMPHERERMIKLIAKTKANGVCFISGDVHYGEISLLKRKGLYPIYDITSSGLTHGHSCAGPNILRVGGCYMQPNFGLITINWEAKNGPQITFELRDAKGDVKLKQETSGKQLSF